MKITLKADSTEKQVELILTDEQLDNSNFIDLIIEDTEITVDRDELQSALYAFQVKETKKDKYE